MAQPEGGCTGTDDYFEILPQPLPLRDTAKLMGHDLKTHIRHYGQWTDEAGLVAAFGAANARLTGRVH